MNDIGAVFLDNVLRNNMVFILSFGLLLVIVETPKLSQSYLKGLKITAGLAVSSLIGWIFFHNISADLVYIFPGIYFLTSLLGIYVINKLGALKGQWIEGIPRKIMALAPFIGLQLYIQEEAVSEVTGFFSLLGLITGFYLTFVVMSAIKEQLKLNETENIFKSEYVVLLVIGFFAAIMVGFNLI